MFARWEELEDKGRIAEAKIARDRLLARMHDLGQFMKTLKEWHSRQYRQAHGWEGTLWRGRYKSILVGESERSFRELALYIAMNPVRAGIETRGADSRWSSYGQSKKSKGSFGWRCHTALLRELARLSGAQTEGTDSQSDAFDARIAEAEKVARDVVRGKIARNESLSLAEMLVCRVHAFGNGLAIGERKNIESVPLRRKCATEVAAGCGLFTATRLRGTMFRVA